MRARRPYQYDYHLPETGATVSPVVAVGLKEKVSAGSKLGRVKLIGDDNNASVLYCRNLDKLTTLEQRMVFICQNKHEFLFSNLGEQEKLVNGATKFLQYEKMLDTPEGIDNLYRYTCFILTHKKPNLLVTAPNKRTCLSIYRYVFLNLTWYSVTSKTRPEYEQGLKYVKWLLLTGILYSFASEHVSKVFIKQQEDSIIDILGAFTHVVAVAAFVFGLSRLFTLIGLLYDGSPRGGIFCFCCRSKKEYGCFSRGLRKARRMRIAFEKFLAMDVQYDTNLTAAHEYDYDSHEDDPVEVVVYIHLKEARLID